MRPPTNPTCDTLQSEMRADMAREHQREQENMREAEQSESDETHCLRVFRPHSSLDRTVTETWGHGSAEEMEALAERKREQHGDLYRFEVQEE